MAASWSCSTSNKFKTRTSFSVCIANVVGFNNFSAPPRCLAAVRWRTSMPMPLESIIGTSARSSNRRDSPALLHGCAGAAVSVDAAGLHHGQAVWRPRPWAAEQSVRTARLAIGEGTLGQAADSRELLVFDASEITREQYAHLDVRRTLRSLAYVPLESKGTLAGLVEILSFDSRVTIDEIRSLK